jgi:glycosyltransferase involved in cell wall biosynthesis
VRTGLNAHLLSFDATYRQAGVSRYIEALLRYVPDVAPEDDLVVFTGPQRPAATAGFDRTIEWRHSRLPTVRPPVRIAWEQTAGVVAARRAHLDVLHSPVNVVPLGVSIPQVVTVHDLGFHHFPGQYPGMKQRYLNAMTRLSIRRAAAVITVSEATRRDVIDVYRVDPAQVVTVPNGVDDSMRPLDDDAINQFRERNGLPDHFVLFLGTLQPRKNIEVLVRAYALLADDLDWPLIIAGAKGWMYERLFALVGEMDLTERVRFTGYVAPEELAYWYNAAAMLVYPSRYEGFGLPLLEAMACGTSVIAANASSLPEVVGDCGVLVEPDDVTGFAEAIRRLAGNDGYRQQLEQAGIERAASFSWRNTARKTVDVYHHVLRQSRQKG